MIHWDEIKEVLEELPTMIIILVILMIAVGMTIMGLVFLVWGLIALLG